MTFKAGILAAAAALTLAVPAAALAQPGRDPNFAGSYYDIPRQTQTQAAPQRQGYAGNPGYAPPAQYRDVYRPDAYHEDRYAVGYRDDRDYRDWRRDEARRDWWRMERMRRMQWDRDHDYRGW